ncbi:MAG TPA: potassium channel family protein [Thermomicrobiales bacterium]|nr:potassium channel family protein [Thermomicrobiales bacterium]
MFPPSELPHLGPLRLPESSPTRALLHRLGLALGLITLSVLLIWLTRDGIRDHVQPGRSLGFVDVLYFSVVSLTTLGYGDISPVTTEARLLNTFLLTPIRVFLWVLFLGTAYELTVMRLRFREERQMRDLHDRLNEHVIIAGYGVKGRAVIDELVAHGQDREQIVVIDPSDKAVKEASAEGIVAFHGDASTEALLKAAAVEKAAYVMVVPNRDDACVLICLTVRSLAPDVSLIAAAREEENIKLIYGAGANMVIAPSVSGGRLMASAVRQHAVPYFLEDLLAFGEGLTVSEYVVPQHQEGLLVREIDELRNDLVLGMMRGMHRYPFHMLADERLQKGDVVVYLSSVPDVERAEARDG